MHRPKRTTAIEIVARAVWLYFRFDLSLLDVEEMLLDRGIVSYETIRRSGTGANTIGFRSVGTLQHFVSIVSGRARPLRPIADQPLGRTNSDPSTPGNGRVGSRECTACLKSAVSA